MNEMQVHAKLTVRVVHVAARPARVRAAARPRRVLPDNTHCKSPSRYCTAALHLLQCHIFANQLLSESIILTQQLIDINVPSYYRIKIEANMFTNS